MTLEKQKSAANHCLRFGNHMSRIGRKTIMLPDGVAVKIEGGIAEVKGPKGTLTLRMPRGISVSQQSGVLVVALEYESRETKKLWGTARALLANMVEGVTKGYEKKLEVEGVGFKANLTGKNLELALGFSHPVKVEAPDGIEFRVEKNAITISGISKELVGRVAAEIRSLKKPEPYKGKGIRYVGEVIRRKAGKKATTTG